MKFGQTEQNVVIHGTLILRLLVGYKEKRRWKIFFDLNDSSGETTAEERTAED